MITIDVDIRHDISKERVLNMCNAKKWRDEDCWIDEVKRLRFVGAPQLTIFIFVQFYFINIECALWVASSPLPYKSSKNLMVFIDVYLFPIIVVSRWHAISYFFTKHTIYGRPLRNSNTCFILLLVMFDCQRTYIRVTWWFGFLNQKH